MSEAVPPDEFRAMLDRAGIALPADEVEDVRQAHAKVVAMLALLREPVPELAAEPAFAFTVSE